MDRHNPFNFIAADAIHFIIGIHPHLFQQKNISHLIRICHCLQYTVHPTLVVQGTSDSKSLLYWKTGVANTSITLFIGIYLGNIKVIVSYFNANTSD